MIKEIDINAPIIPYDSIGGIKLYTHIKELQELLKNYKHTYYMYMDYLVKYELSGIISFNINILNGKVFAISALKGYKGKLYGKITVGMHIDKVLEIEPNFIYEDFEEFYYNIDSVTFETDPVDYTVLDLGIGIKEYSQDNFDNGDW